MGKGKGMVQTSMKFLTAAMVSLGLIAGLFSMDGCAPAASIKKGDPGPSRRSVEDDRRGESPSQITRDTSPERAASLRLSGRGESALEEGRAEEAVDHLERAIQIDPSNPFAYYYFGQARLAQGRPEEALTLLSRAEVLFHDRSHWLCETLVAMGRILEEMGRVQEAAGCFRRALDADPWSEAAAAGLERTEES